MHTQVEDSDVDAVMRLKAEHSLFCFDRLEADQIEIRPKWPAPVFRTPG